MKIEELKELVIKKLKTIHDPEIPVNVYDLGLIYDVQITLKKEVVILMTLTAPNCPEAESIPINIEKEIKNIPEITNCKVIITFDPPWDPKNLSEDITLLLGLL